MQPHKIDLCRDLGRDVRFSTILADPPWRFDNRSGKAAPEYKKVVRYKTLPLTAICEMNVDEVAEVGCHLYLCTPNALLPDALDVMKAWNFIYKSNIVWRKIRKDGGSDGRGVGYYFRNVTELILFGVKGGKMRTLEAGRRQVNFMESRKRDHSRKPDEQYELIESCSRGPFLELFGRSRRAGWTSWGDEVESVTAVDASLLAAAE